MASRDEGINDTNRAILKVAKVIEGRKQFDLAIYKKLAPLLDAARVACESAIAHYGDPSVKWHRKANRLMRDIKRTREAK